MQFIADLHIHSKYSRACSKELSITNLEKWARIKGVNLLGTGDFTHPLWYKELKASLTEIEKGSGFFQTKTGFSFILQTEISLIYTQDKKGRKVHNIVFAPSFQAVEEITKSLLKRGRVDYDGRPIFNIPCPEFVEMMKNIDERIQVIPAHAWTPWFSLFGANSGFDSLKDCFREQTKNIHAIETGLSSNPPMNWRLKQLDSINLVSFSDLHSYWPWRLGREATVFDIEPSFDALAKAIETGKGMTKTIEVNPNLGKYHFTGHRNCSVCLAPTEAKKLKNICQKCGSTLTVGVEQRVDELADRPLGYKPENAKPFLSLLPLSDLLSLSYKKPVASKSIWELYFKLIDQTSNEINFLLNKPIEEVAAATTQEFAEVIQKNREGKIKVTPGYDGVYGTPILNDNNEEFYEKNKKEDYRKKQQKVSNLKFQHKQMGLSEFFG